MPEFEQFSWSPKEPFHRGDTVALELMTARIMEVTDDGRPIQEDFIFKNNIDDFAFAKWTKTEPVRCDPPKMGEHLKLFLPVF